MKCHVGVDAFTGMVHTCEATSANVSDIEVAPKLLREDDEVVYGDSAYSALHKREEILSNENFANIIFKTNTKKHTERMSGQMVRQYTGATIWNTESQASEVRWSMFSTL